MIDINFGINKCLDNIGIIVDEEIYMETELSKYIPDSISFITLIVELEQYFNIEIPDEFLLVDKWNTFGDANFIVKIILSEKQNSICT